MDKRKEIILFVSSLKRLIIASGSNSFYDLFYFSCAEDYSEDVPLLAFTYRKFNEYGIPTILYGPMLIDFINEASTTVSKENLKKMDIYININNLPPDKIEMLKKVYVFRELVKHEIIHFINLHLPRTHEFFNKKQLTLNDGYLTISNVLADSICNRYLDPSIINNLRLVPPLENEVPLETLLEESLKNNSNSNSSNDSKSGGPSKGLKDVLKEVEEYKKFKDFLKDDGADVDIEGLKERVKNVVERVSSMVAGKVPSEIEETLRWLRKKRVKFQIQGSKELFTAFRNLERNYIHYNPLNQNPYGFVFPTYRNLSGNKAVVLIVDTSGSMNEEQLEYTFDFLNHLTKQHTVYLVEIDATIQRVRKVKALKTDELTFKGRGGTVFTDLENLPIHIPKDEVIACIILTDGFIAEFPSENPYKNIPWFGLTTGKVPNNSPKWIKWLKVSEVVE